MELTLNAQSATDSITLPRRNRGMVLLMTLVILVILTLSSLAMMKLLSSGITTSGNIAFRQAAVRVGDLATEGARTWIAAQSAVALQADIPTSGYYSTDDPNFNPATFNFYDPTIAVQYCSSQPCVAGTNDTFSGYQVYYVIHRMALAGGGVGTLGTACSDPAAGCAQPPVASTSVTHAGNNATAGASYQSQINGATGLVYYRITAKVAGPRFNNRYVQVFVY